MGVRGLLTFVNEKMEEEVKEVDLCKLARERQGIEILVDLQAFKREVLGDMWRYLYRVSGNQYAHWLEQIDYQFVDRYMKNYVAIFRTHKIELVFYNDGALGSSIDQGERKLDTWKERHLKCLEAFPALIDLCSGKTDPPVPGLLPVLTDIQLYQSLKECGCQLVQMVTGEADFAIAADLMRRPKAFAVLSNDTDFCIFKGCIFIHVDWFEVGPLLGVDPKPKIQLAEFTTQYVTQRMVCNKLGLTDNQLVEFAILCGNDFTNHELNRLELKKTLGVYNIWSIANWIKKNGTIEDNPLVAREEDLMQGIYHSRAFYTCSLSNEPVDAGEQVSDHIAAGIRDLKYPNTLQAIHNRIFWHKVFVEDSGPDQPVAEMQLTELRRYIYKFIVPDGGYVTEYGRSSTEPLIERKVTPTPVDLPKIHEIRPDEKQQNLETFYMVMTHQEHEEDGTAFRDRIRKYDSKTGFMACVLRYLLVMNHGKNLNLTREEFRDFAAAILAIQNLNVRFYLSLGIRPSIRCVTIENWCEDVYRHAHDFLAKILMVSDEFPTAGEMFSPSVWTAFYMLREGRGEVFAKKWKEPVPITEGQRRRIQGEREKMLEERQNVIADIMEGVFQEGNSRKPSQVQPADDRCEEPAASEPKLDFRPRYGRGPSASTKWEPRREDRPDGSHDQYKDESRATFRLKKAN